MKKSSKVRMTFSLNQDVEKLLREIANRTGLKMTTIIEMAVKKINHEI